MAVRLEDILKLSVSERVRLVEEIWDSIAAHPAALPLSRLQAAELDRRLKLHERDPAKGSPWPAVRGRIKRKLARRRR
jgi:putative addiction module component (TIGR02574 family)